MITETPVLAVPYPDDALAYLSLPVSADDGFPQSFLLDIDNKVYRLTFGLTYSDPALVLSPQFASSFFNLPDPVLGLYLTLTVEDETLPPADRVLGVSRIVTGSPVAIGPLRFLFSRLRIAQGNLAGPGNLGSEVAGKVAVANG